MRLQSQLSVTFANVKKYYYFPSLTKYLESRGRPALAPSPVCTGPGAFTRAALGQRPARAMVAVRQSRAPRPAPRARGAA